MMIDSFMIGLIIVSAISSLVGGVMGVVTVWYVEYKLDPKNKVR